ncbi:MAG TPA: hypothetical protein VGP12_08485, partial [Nitrosospira sp.]|nr:hypothetical protein [Nitrosospira sp.]
MKLLFMENRQATYLWEAVARLIEKDGHEIHWIVENRGFAPSVGRVNIIPYPSDEDAFTGSLPQHLKEITDTDRNITYFGGDARHYAYYDQHIWQILKNVLPDFVFGEQTLFHELIAVHYCRRLNIPYLVPSNTRYPTGRTAFYAYDTYDPFGGSGERLSDNEAKNLIHLIRDCRSAPDYMAPSSAGVISRLLEKIDDRVRITGSYLFGERYNTPSPSRKLALEIQHKKRVRDWEQIAVEDIGPVVGRRPWLLYPLHMQPESSIDVYGRP